MTTPDAWYGGAITASVSTLFPTFLDASKFRQLPDNQEVFVDKDIESSQSLIVELVEASREENAPQFYFNQLAEDNDARPASIETIGQVDCPHLPKGTNVSVVCGVQKVAKFNEDAVNQVGIIMAIVRLENVETDMLISLNIPVSVAATSSEAAPSGNVNLQDANVSMVSLLQSIRINDWSLFSA